MSEGAVATARAVADRFRDPALVERALAMTREHTTLPKSVHWQSYAIGQGFAGLAVACAYLDAVFPDEEWDAIGHMYLNLAIEPLEIRRERDGLRFYCGEMALRPGLFSGLSGLAFAALSLSRGGTRYARLLNTIETALLPATIELVGNLPQGRTGVSVGHFDVISGLSGVGAYLLCRRERPEALDVLHLILRSLAALSEEREGLPGWYTPVHLLGDEDAKKQYSNGNINCGLAHGVPGPLALLSLACLSGCATDGAIEAVDRVAAWLSRHRRQTRWGVDWPSAVPLQADGLTWVQQGVDRSPDHHPTRTAWCYGSPGVARGLWLAGQALGDAGAPYRDLAVKAMSSCLQRPIQLRNIDSPTFCHGRAGLLQIVLRFVHDTRSHVFRDAARQLTQELISMYEPGTLVGYRDIESGGSGNRVERPGLLSGAPGVAMVLLAAATSAEPSWDRLFLLG